MATKEQVLLELGLRQNEAKVYLALAELGLTTITKITEHTKLFSANVYDALKRLNKRGLISYIIKDGKKYFEISDPTNLLKLVKEKEFAVKSIIPELILSKQLAPTTSNAQIFEGATAFQMILLSFLKYNEPILVYGIPKEAPEMMKTFIPHFHKKRIAKKIVMKHIYNHNAQDRIKYLNSLPLTEARYLPSQYDSKVSTNICGDEVVFVLWKKPVWVVQIKNKDIADAYKNYFELLWRDAIV